MFELGALRKVHKLYGLTHLPLFVCLIRERSGRSISYTDSLISTCLLSHEERSGRYIRYKYSLTSHDWLVLHGFMCYMHVLSPP